MIGVLSVVDTDISRAYRQAIVKRGFLCTKENFIFSYSLSYSLSNARISLPLLNVSVQMKHPTLESSHRPLYEWNCLSELNVHVRGFVFFVEYSKTYQKGSKRLVYITKQSKEYPQTRRFKLNILQTEKIE